MVTVTLPFWEYTLFSDIPWDSQIVQLSDLVPKNLEPQPKQNHGLQPDAGPQLGNPWSLTVPWALWSPAISVGYGRLIVSGAPYGSIYGPYVWSFSARAALNHPVCLVQWLDQKTHPNRKGPAGAAGFSAGVPLLVWSQKRLAQLAETSPRSSRYTYIYSETWLWCLAQKLLRRFWHWHIFGTEFPWKSGLRPWHARKVDGGLTTLATTGRWCVIQRWICAWLIIDVLTKKSLRLLYIPIGGEDMLRNYSTNVLAVWSCIISDTYYHDLWNIASRLEGALQKVPWNLCTTDRRLAESSRNHFRNRRFLPIHRNFRFREICGLKTGSEKRSWSLNMILHGWKNGIPLSTRDTRVLDMAIAAMSKISLEYAAMITFP